MVGISARGSWRPPPSTVDEKEILQPLPSVEEIAVNHRDDVNSKVRNYLQKYCSELANMHDQNDAYLRAINFGIASRIGKRFLRQLQLNVQMRRKNRYAVSWFRQRLIRKVFNKYSQVVAKIIVEKHQNQNSEEKKTVQSGKFPGLFTHDEIKNPKME